MSSASAPKARAQRAEGERRLGPRQGGAPKARAQRAEGERRLGPRQGGERSPGAGERRAGEDEPIRAFFAVELPEEVRRAASEVVRVLRGRPGGRDVRWVRPENLHVTLRFLGNVSREDAAALAQAAARAMRAHPAFELRLGGVHGFPTARRPRVVALALEPEGPLAALAADLERAAVAHGLAPEARGFRAHATLGRMQGRGAAPQRGAAERSSGRRGVRSIEALLRGAPAPACAPFPVRGIALVRSRLGPGGSTYTPLERIALGGGDHPDATASTEE